MDGDITCVVCQKSITPDKSSSKLTKKGCDGINTASVARHSDICASPGQHVHKDCRQVFTNDRYIEQANRKRLGDKTPTSTKPSLRSSIGTFEYANQCLFCGQGDPRQGRDPQLKLHPVRTLTSRIVS